MRLLVAAGLALAVAAAAVLIHHTTTRSTAGAGVATVTLHPGTPSTIRITDDWTLSVPAGGVRGISELTITTTPAHEFVQVGAIALGSADLTLSSGHPALPWTVSWELDEPLPDDEYLYLVSESGPGPSLFRADTDLGLPLGALDVVPAQLDQDRTVATAQVQHLSAKTWFRSGTEQLGQLWDETREFGEAFAGSAQALAGDTTHLLADALGNRGQRPECEPFDRPGWVHDVIFLDDRNAPMLVCASGTEEVPSGLVVQIVNNRGMDMRVHSPLRPAAVALVSPGGGAIPQDVDGPVLVPGRERVDLYFGPEVTAASSPLEIVSAFTPEGFARAMASTLTAGLLDQATLDDPVGYAWAQAKNRICALDPAEQAGSDEAARFAYVLEHTECLTERHAEIVQGVRSSMSPAEWDRAGGTVTRIGNVAARASAAFAALPAFDIFDAALTSGLIDAAYRVQVSWIPLPDPCGGPEAFRRVVQVADPTALSGASTTVAFDDQVRCADGVAHALVSYSDLGSGAGHAYLIPETGGYRLEVYDSVPACSEHDRAIPAQLYQGSCITEEMLNPPEPRFGPADNPFGCNFDPDAGGHEDPCGWRWTRTGDPGEPGDADAGLDGYVADADAEIEGGGSPAQRWRACYAGYRSFCE